MKGILAERKLVFYKKQVKSLTVPGWPELKVELMWPLAIKSCPEFLRYMPDGWNGDHKTERRFFWGVFATLNQPLVESIIDDFRGQRSIPKEIKKIDIGKLDITPNMLAKMLSKPIRTCKCTW
jgi:hypothetical protein